MLLLSPETGSHYLKVQSVPRDKGMHHSSNFIRGLTRKVPGWVAEFLPIQKKRYMYSLIVVI